VELETVQAVVVLPAALVQLLVLQVARRLAVPVELVTELLALVELEVI
jgi:hypothetical protein